MTATVSATTHKAAKKGILFALIAAFLLSLFTPRDIFAASTSTVNRHYDQLYSGCIIRQLDMYARDNFKITYEKGKKVVSVKVTQTAKNLGTQMLEKGGVKLVKKTNDTWTYQTTWHLNLSVIPTCMKKLVNLACPGLGKLCNFGRLATATYTYTVDKYGNLKYTGRTAKLDVKLSGSLLTDAKKICSWFNIKL